ncbi:hypothetical protein ACIQGZ_17140 [Streptomyces sp. NPDC092296]|uniref:hypothetical protein n=1 Tax=Streptomyces sp. NPDC092296 TaxID=3366012 RepID=UPI00381DA5CE
MTFPTLDVHTPAKISAALAPLLPDDATLPLRTHRTTDGILAAYSPAQLTRAAAWHLLRAVFGDLDDATPCTSCDRTTPEDDLGADANGDPTCRDCLDTHAGLDDAREWRTRTYA